jgi:hypothetical protein
MALKPLITRALCASAAMIGAIVGTSPAGAVDVDPGDYTALKPGTNLLLMYGIYTNRDQLNVPGVGDLKAGTHLDSAIGLFRFVHFMKLGPLIVDPQIIVPYGTVYNGKVAGQRLKSSTGFGDINPFATFWFIHHDDPVHASYVGFSPIISFPTGQYDHNKATSIGGNRYVYDMQLGAVQGIAKNVTVDLYGDYIFYGNNTNYGADHQTLTQKDTTAIQAYGRYNLSPKTSLSLGYAKYWGGRQDVDGVYNGTKTDNQQVRLVAQTMIAPTIQLEGIAGRMVQVNGGFREKVRLQVRVLKIF